MKSAIEYYYAGTVKAAMLTIFNETGAQMTEIKKYEGEIVDDKYEMQKLNGNSQEDISTIAN